MTARTPEDVDRQFAEALNAGSLDALVALYESQAALTPMPDKLVTGTAAIRESLAGFLAGKPHITLTPRLVAQTGDVAVVSAEWELLVIGPDGKEVVARARGLLSNPGRVPRLLVECSSISLAGSAQLRRLLQARDVQMLAAPVSGNAKVIKAGRLSFVCSGPKSAFDAALPYLKMIAPAASYVGEGELARIVKICHNVFLGVVTQSLAEITVLAQKAGVPRHAFLDFMNQSVMGSTFSRYKTPAFVNLDFKVTFTPALLRKDLDLGLDAAKRFEVPMPLACATRDLVQSMMGRGWTEQDFATLLLQQAQASGIELEPENVDVKDGLS